MDDKVFADALGSVITDYRKSTYPDMSSREFAEKCGISRAVIRDLENKKHNGIICSTTLKRISHGLGLEDSQKMADLIKHYLDDSNYEMEKGKKEEVILRKDTPLFDLFETVKELSDEDIEMLHKFALKLLK